ncbi:MAG TPA: hypothetical protein PKJ94_09355 [Ferruginibacter sp.]|nr:hypothetical protein [Ferruginibacter sp.]
MYFSAKTSRIVFLYVLLLFLLPATAQNKNEKQAEQKKLEQIITESKAVADKIENTARLAVFYNKHKNTKAVDSLIKLIFELGSASGKKQDMFMAYRWAALPYSNNSDLQKWRSYIEQALTFAIKERLPNEEALMLSFLGRKYAQLRDFNKANEYYNRVDLNKDGIEDTTRYHYFYRKWEMFLIQQKMLEAIKNLFAAKKYAERSKVTKCIAEANHYLGEGFQQVKEYEKAIAYYQASKKEYEKIADFNNVLKQQGYVANVYGMMKNYPVAEKLWEENIRIADSIDYYEAKYIAVAGLWGIYAKQNQFTKGAETGRKYKLIDYYYRLGDSARIYNTNAVYAEIDGRYDSADWYYRRTISYCKKSFPPVVTAYYTYYYADYLKRYKRYTEALPQMQFALNTFDSLHEVSGLQDVYNNLDSIYSALGDYKNAWQARGNFYMYRDSIENQSKKEDILKEEIAAEEESMRKTAEEELKATERKHNLQYTAIMIGGMILLISLLLLGFFNTPNWLIRLLGFVSFIFLFEFIILLLDSKLHHWFHGAPLPILAVKVLIACALVPLHHVIEHRVIHFLQSKKLHRLKTVFKDEPVKDPVA